MRKAFVDEYGLIINFKLPEDEQEGEDSLRIKRNRTEREKERLQ